jgi:LuxR family transcriptional regulator, maltose regulon positive regulatory protein
VLAKLSRPRPAGAHARERLFARLDECLRDAVAVWIAAPPGAGKTTLVASWLDARALRALWYQVDAGDGDPASFFYHLGLGAKQAGLSRKVHLPLLTPEYMPDIAGFTRRYFRSLCQGLPQPCVLVLDNVQDAPEASPFGAVLRDALGELPQGTHAVLVSRTEPPAEHARLRASKVLAELGWDELRLTEDEAAQIAANAHRVPTAGIGALVERCGGWAAGLTLLLDHARATGSSVADAPRSPQALFDYFAAELFDRLPQPTQQLLLRTALLPWVSVEMARSLSGNDNAGALLEGLRRKHLFTDRRAGADASYQYHALFREFLEIRMHETYSRSERQRLVHNSAQLLAGVEQSNAALQLYLTAGDEGAAVQLVLGHAPVLAAQGRLQTLAAQIGALPADTSERVPWLAYWLGTCEFGPDLATSRRRLEVAFERFGAQADTLGQAVTAAGIIETHNVEYRNFTLLDPWIAELHRLLDSKLVFPDFRFELGVLGSLLSALVIRRPGHELLAPYVARVRSLVDVAADVNTRVAGASHLLHYYVFLEETHACEELIACIRPHLKDPKLSPHNGCIWLQFQSLYFQFLRYDSREANESMDAALDLIERNGLRHCAIQLRAQAAMLRLEAADVEGAARQLAQASPGLDGLRFDMAWHNGAHSWLALLRGDHEGAVLHAKRMVYECASAGMPHGHGIALMLRANALAAAGDGAGALERLRRSNQGHVARRSVGDLTVYLIEANLHLMCGDLAAAEGTLRHAFLIGRQHKLFNTFQWLAPQMSRLCAFALEHDIETAYVTELIRVRGLMPLSPDTPVWPWPIKVHTLRRFEILKGDQALHFEGKTQRKPLALLKALIVLGGADVPEDKLIDIVWAESLEGDQQKAFDVTLHRLRKLLGNDKAIQVSDRRVSLNREIVWVDLWALERRLAAVVPVGPASLPDAAQLERAAPAILDLYRGQLLDGDADSSWLLPVRNRLNGRFQRFVIRLGEHRELARQWGRAGELYERGSSSIRWPRRSAAG